MSESDASSIHLLNKPDAASTCPPLNYRTNLPIYACREEIIQTLRRNRVLIIAGSTGSGKTTQLPLMCLEAGRGTRGRIGVTQPRRIAATSIASRIAEDMGVPVGTLVGYKTRFEHRESQDTVVRFMTDGILLNETVSDRYLNKYDTLIIDEVHERNLNIDFILGYLRILLSWRKDLNVIISSATADTELLSKAFADAPVINVAGTLFPVEVVYSPPAQEEGEGAYVEAACDAIKAIVDMRDDGDVLVFLPSEGDIAESQRKLAGMNLAQTLVLPLYGRLQKKQQDMVFHPSNRQKIILATNIAETSLTIPNIRFVVDTGLARIKRVTPHTRVTRLPIESISRASADQRKGRCGRVQEGMCVRLYTEEDYLGREEFTQPEIMRCNLADVILMMATLKLGTVENFPFIQPPPSRSVPPTAPR